ncbi:hypothetical protein DO659_24075 [Salmonella enterica subsp. enterica serovar Minnesota]|nr:hypothetical protein [Salmonella enterica subsp. enterica serovar Minnesota]
MRQNSLFRWKMAVAVVLSGTLLLGGCVSRNTQEEKEGLQEALSPEAEQDLLGDLNIYVQHLLNQRTSGNENAERVLVRMLSGRGLPEQASPVERG